MRDPAEAYFAELSAIRASGAGVAETSYYGALATLLTDVGSRLKPKVRAFMQLKNRGAGYPDGGLFEQKQYAHAHDAAPLEGQMPNRGAIEVKGTGDDVFDWSQWPDPTQVPRYAERYGLVLVANLRDFVLVRWDAAKGEARLLESCRLATSEAQFWANATQPRKFAEVAGEGLTEFLQRVMLHSAPIADPKDVAWWLASYARTARLRLEHRDLPALGQLREQLEEALGLKFEGEKGDHFFRSTLVQTLFYGMFASWVLFSRELPPGESPRFRWREASWTLHVPMIAQLFEQIATPSKLGELHIAEVLDWAEEVLNRVERAQFFSRFKEEHAVQYFYEPFLEAFDPELRKELGVWYTPEEVVRYMVARVDTVLREELDIADGLADPSVYVLDPCCGTGAYLVEVLKTIDRTLQAKGADALTRQDVKRAAMERVIGFEIMPAPFVISHLQLGILLRELDVPLSDTDSERAAVYLTNSLTGWGDGTRETPPKDRRVGEGQMHATLLLPEFAGERDAADGVKRQAPILVVLGNPPYNGFAGIAVDEERELSDTYRETKRAPRPQGQGLNDLYVRFFRVAERQIAERTGRGVVCLITNNSWLDSRSHPGMRERFLDVFDDIWIDNLNGDKYRTGKLTPEGEPDPSIFSTATNREGIQVGTSITLLARRQESSGSAAVHLRDFWGNAKREQLVGDSSSRPAYSSVLPTIGSGLALLPSDTHPGYYLWPSLEDVFPVFFPGVQSKRDEVVVDIDREPLELRMRAYCDATVSETTLSEFAPRAMTSTAQYDAQEVRAHLIQRGFLEEYLVPYLYRPFDVRWVYWEPDYPLLSRRVPEYFPQVTSGNVWFSAVQRNRMGGFYRPVVTPLLSDHHLVESNVSMFPLLLSGRSDEQAEAQSEPNLSLVARHYAEEEGVQAEQLMSHVIAVLDAPRYATDNQGGFRQGWPRVPFPREVSVLSASAALGRTVGDLLDTQAVIPGVTGFTPTRGLASLGVLWTMNSVALDPATGLAVTAHWGIAGKGGICMPSTGKLTERPYTDDELAAIAEHADSLGMSRDEAVALLGETCFDVYLNDVAYWRCVPANVWRYTIGGYQVIKKWLSYRERALLGRDLKPEEARYVTEMVRRIAALVLMQPELDANYERVKADVWEWGRCSE